MKQMKTLTVNGITYAVTDPTAPRIDDTVLGDAPWSAKKIVDTLCPGFTKTGSIVTCTPVAGYPLEVAAENTVTRCGKNLFDFTKRPYAVTYVNASGNSIDRYGFAIFLPAGTYILHAEEITPSANEYFLYGTHMGADGTYRGSCSLRGGSTNHIRTVTLEQGDSILLYDGTGGSLQQAADMFAKFNIQVEAGTAVTAFAAYAGESFAPGEPVPALPGINTLWAESGAITVTGRSDPTYTATEAGGAENGI